MLISVPVSGDTAAFFSGIEKLDDASTGSGTIADIKDKYSERMAFWESDLLEIEDSPKEFLEGQRGNTSEYLAVITGTESRLGLIVGEDDDTGEPGSPAGLDITYTDPVSHVSYSAAKGAGERAPINSEFLSYLEKMYSGDREECGGDYPLGYIPSPVDLSHNTGKEISVFNMQTSGAGKSYTLPETYLVSAIASDKSDSVVSTVNGLDLRATNKVSDVENQEQCGSCWAFCTYSSLESTLLPDESWDFSENNLKNRHGYDFAPCKGGNSLMSTAYLARWDGPVTEAADPYNSISSSSPANLEEVKHVQEVWFIPSRSGPLDNENIKMALTKEGALYSTLYWNDAYFSGLRNSYYYGGSASGNHAITIVGWDDSYDRTNFERLPPGNGAFIVKNSWGTEWGDGGFFYVSYYDTRIGMDNALFMAEKKDNYENIYQYDPLGWVVSYGAGSDTEYFANIFTSAGSEELKAVSFYSPVPDASYQIQIYLNCNTNPTTGRQAGTVSGSIPLPGYHTINLETPIRLSSGQKFSIVVKITTPGYQYPVAMEYPYSGFSSRATANSKESFVSSNGNSWTDITTIYPNTNVCLKAFTTGAGVVQTIIPTPTPTSVPTAVPTLTPTPAPTDETDTTPPSISLDSPGSYTTVTRGSAVTIQWSSSDNTGIAGVSVEYSTDGKSSWNPVGKNLGGSGSVEWIVPDTASPGVAYIRVTAVDTSGNSAYKMRSIIISTGSAYIPSSLTGNADTGLYPDGWIDPSSAGNSSASDSTAARLQRLPEADYIISKLESPSKNPLSGYSRIISDSKGDTYPATKMPGSRIPSPVLSQWKKE